jgi:DNA repair protein RadC
MRALGQEDRPREKLERHGVSALGDNELLALVIGHGTRGADALSLANRLLSAAGGVAGLTRMDRGALHAVPGVGAVGAARIQAAVEIGRRTLARAMPPRRQIVSPRDAADVLLPEHGAHPVERVGIMLLDTRHRVLRVQLVSSGVADASVATPRDVFRAAIAGGAAAVILFHNHPSGDLEPSKEDLDLTERMAAAGEVLGVHLLDHLILADRAFVSLNDHLRRRARRA